MDPITIMILASVGIQFFNNWCSTKQNKKLQQKREEFQRAAQQRQTERMWQIMREGQQLTLQLEAEKHRQRIEDLKKDVSNLMLEMAQQIAMQQWPLNVLPIVMKNQTIGNIISGQEEKIALHCILTPSNYNKFNNQVFPTIEKQLERYCNTYWSVSSKHPILFYSGGWRGTEGPMETQFDSMYTEVKNLPVLAITPLYRPTDGKLVFEMRTWGLGNDNGIDRKEIEPQNFQQQYTRNDDYQTDKNLAAKITAEIEPYLECLIGYITDTYFWAAFGTAPQLPKLLTSKAIDTVGKDYLVHNCRNYYEGLKVEAEMELNEKSFILDNISVEEKYGRKSNVNQANNVLPQNKSSIVNETNKYRF